MLKGSLSKTHFCSRTNFHVLFSVESYTSSGIVIRSTMLSAVRNPGTSMAGITKLFPSPVFQFRTASLPTGVAADGTGSGGAVIWAWTSTPAVRIKRTAAVWRGDVRTGRNREDGAAGKLMVCGWLSPGSVMTLRQHHNGVLP